jgi:hypothetical protein
MQANLLANQGRFIQKSCFVLKTRFITGLKQCADF